MGLAAKFNITPLLGGLALALALFPPALQGRTSAPETQDEIFLAARAAVRKGDFDKLAEYEERLQGYLLLPYVEYWRLLPRLEDAPAAEVRGFLAREQGGPLAQQVRKEWMKALGKKKQWDLFREEYPLLADPDEDIACYALEERWGRGDASALEEVRAHWYAPRDLPEGCVPLAEALITQGRFTTRHVWERIRLLLEVRAVSAAWRTAEYLPDSQALNRAELFAVAAGAQRYLDDKRRGKDLSRREVRELTMFAVHRLARTDPEAAAYRWEHKLSGKFSAEERGYVWGQLALRAARRNLPQALLWYGKAEAEGARLSEEQLAWRMRAALRQGNWREVSATADMMAPPQRNEPAWVYWRGRAAQARGDAAAARSLFERIADGHDFYARLAAEELGLAFVIPPKGYAPTPREVAALGREPRFQRALALYRLGLRYQSTREWIWAIRGMVDKELLAAAEFARRNEMYDRAINTANKTLTLHDFSVRYLAPYREALGENARAQQLEEALVLGLVRQESRFIPEIKSSAGATGLMQLMPATARWVARRMGMRDYSWSRVTDADVNAALGTFYLRHVMDDLDGNPVLAAAAYNAGPGRARRWRDATRALEGAVYAETIPFDETRDYVKKVMNNTMYYAAMLKGQTRSLKARLGVIAPRGGSAAQRDAKEDEQQ